jgi:hypothetical protein
MNYIFDIVSTLFRNKANNSWMNDIIDQYYSLKDKNEKLVIICPSDCEYDSKCRVIDKINNDKYIVLGCTHDASVTIFREYKYKGEYQRFYSVPGVDEWRIKV